MPELRLGQVSHEPLQEGDVTFSFGDGFDAGSLNAFLASLQDHIVMIDDVDYQFWGAGYGEDGGWALFVYHVDNNSLPVGAILELDFSKVRRIHVY